MSRSTSTGQVAVSDDTSEADIDVEPDYRFTLANERTFLAWIRTSLGLTAGGLAAVHYLPEISGHAALYQALGSALIVAGALIPIMAQFRWRRVQHAMRRTAPLPSTIAPLAVAAILVLTGGVCLLAATTGS